MTNTLREKLDERYAGLQIEENLAEETDGDEGDYTLFIDVGNEMIDAWPTISVKLKLADALAEWAIQENGCVVCWGGMINNMRTPRHEDGCPVAKYQEAGE